MKKTLIFSFVCILMVFPLLPKGNWEIGAHYSFWSIDIISPLIEDITPDIKGYDTSKASFNFNSNGNNLGFGVRFFPGGENGSFSIGLSYERNSFKAKLDGSYSDIDKSGYNYSATASGSIDLAPHSVNFSVRWELWPTKRVHPYIGLGLGLGQQIGLVVIHSRVVTDIAGLDVIEEYDESWDFDALKEEYKKEEGKDFPVGFFPIVHLNFGFRGKIVDNVYLLAEIAIYDGLIFRGGVAYRF